MPLDLILGVKLEAEDDDLVSDRTFARRRAVQHDLAASPFSSHRVGGEPFPVVEIGNDDGFIGQDPGRLQQILIHGQAALVVEAGIGHRRAMNLGPQHLPKHLFNLGYGQAFGVKVSVSGSSDMFPINLYVLRYFSILRYTTTTSTDFTP